MSLLTVLFFYLMYLRPQRGKLLNYICYFITAFDIEANNLGYR